MTWSGLTKTPQLGIRELDAVAHSENGEVECSKNDVVERSEDGVVDAQGGWGLAALKRGWVAGEDKSTSSDSAPLGAPASSTNLPPQFDLSVSNGFWACLQVGDV
jgi:hypothetical protein